MDAASEPLDELVSHARATRVVVVGGGIAGLVAAWECAKVGMPVTLIEADDRFGGTIAAADLAGLRTDLGVTCWSAGSAARALVDELGLAGRVVTPRTDRTWIAGVGRGGAAPVPPETVVGIPANPWDESVRRFIGWSGAWRAYLDRLRPPLTIGKERNLDRLVRTRMGAPVADRMVAPLSVGRFGIAPAKVDVSAAAPGLSTALTRTGSLGGAVAELLVDRGDRPAVESLEGGMTVLVDALVTRLADLGAELRPSTRVASLARADDRWTATVEGADDPDLLPAEIVIVAAGPHEAARLLTPHVGEAVAEMTDAALLREIVTLVVDAPALDAGPRGAQVYPLPARRRASGLVHETARWEWLAREAGPGRHVLHVAFDRAAGDPESVFSDGDDPAVIARQEASALLGVALEPSAVRASHHAVFPLALPASALGHDDHAEAVRTAVAGVPGLAATGAWFAGSGLGRVVAAARDEAERVRAAALWGPPSSP
ncbi:protoporphyrinogen/coproporphyrinogen oxidase [Microbacterium sp. NPDC057407]|uniref:protoporphyrinogen/coproporphyrinogen oxidase n=1 Tax=Microbacterium sp. NPDC057407 TaxID=3346120 RepID=UPI00366E0C39